jgi:hypothetical protein
MKRVFGGLFAVSLVGLLVAAPARAQRPHVPLPTPDPVVLEGYCTGFTAVITFTEMSQYIIRETTADGTTTLKITGHAQATVTNKTTGESVSLTTSADPERS